MQTFTKPPYLCLIFALSMHSQVFSMAMGKSQIRGVDIFEPHVTDIAEPKREDTHRFVLRPRTKSLPLACCHLSWTRPSRVFLYDLSTNHELARRLSKSSIVSFASSLPWPISSSLLSHRRRSSFFTRFQLRSTSPLPPFFDTFLYARSDPF
jgi:hypothetical protein